MARESDLVAELRATVAALAEKNNHLESDLMSLRRDYASLEAVLDETGAMVMELQTMVRPFMIAAVPSRTHASSTLTYISIAYRCTQKYRQEQATNVALREACAAAQAVTVSTASSPQRTLLATRPTRPQPQLQPRERQRQSHAYHVHVRDSLRSLAERLVDDLVAVEESLDLLGPLAHPSSGGALPPPHTSTNSSSRTPPPPSPRLRDSERGSESSSSSSSSGGGGGRGNVDFLFGSPSARLPIVPIASEDREDEEDEGEEDERDVDG